MSVVAQREIALVSENVVEVKVKGVKGVKEAMVARRAVVKIKRNKMKITNLPKTDVPSSSHNSL